MNVKYRTEEKSMKQPHSLLTVSNPSYDSNAINTSASRTLACHELRLGGRKEAFCVKGILLSGGFMPEVSRLLNGRGFILQIATLKYI